MSKFRQHCGIGIALVAIYSFGCKKKKDVESTPVKTDLACYSPDQNLDKAYNADAVGCACPKDSAGVCKSRAETGLDRYVALVCTDGKWVAVLDGPCGPPPR
jgi:hypothetical protein